MAQRAVTAESPKSSPVHGESKRNASDSLSRSISKPISGHYNLTELNEIDERSKSIIRTLREQVPELQPSSPLFIRFDDQYLHRFVRARKYHVSEVLVMVKNHVEWFKHFRVQEIAEFEFTELEQFRTVYPHGYHGLDKLGRPLYIERYSKMNADYLFKISSLERVSRYWVQGYENLLFHRFPTSSREGRPIMQTCVILDLQGIKLSTFDSKAREFLRTVSKISSDNYPETLGVMFIVNVPSFFSIVYSVAKPLIPPETKKKIHVLTSRNVKNELLKHIDADQLPQFLGGSCVCDPKNHTDDKGCLSSDKGPWNAVKGDDIDEFVSCHENEGFRSGSFDSAVNHVDISPNQTIEYEDGPIVRRNPVRSWFRLGGCFGGKK